MKRDPDIDALNASLAQEDPAPMPSSWPPALAGLGIVLALLLVTYWRTAESMVDIWRHSETFAHGFLVVPIAAWLIWRDRHRLRGLAPRPDAWAAAALAGMGVGWMVSELASVNAPAQLALVLMIQGATWALLGTRVAAALAFPLAFLLFAVPMGEFLLPTLMRWTADFTVLALRATGIPVYREGLNFVIPSGSWSVVEACSGIRYLIASLMVGVLYAHLTYRSLSRRLAFVAAAIVVPLIANWLRAYMIVMIGHLTNNEYATGVDHLIYGWIFFGLVMLLLFWIGGFWQETAGAPQEAAAGVAAPAVQPRSHFALVALLTLAAALPWRSVAAMLDQWDDRAPARLDALPAAGGWSTQPGTLSGWRPIFRNPTSLVEQTYRRGPAEVGVVVAYYRAQQQDKELVNSENKLVTSADMRWREVGSGQRSLARPPRLSVHMTDLRGERERLVVWQWYWVGGKETTGDIEAKLLLARSKLLLQGDDSAAVLVYTRYDDTREAGEAVLRQFVADMAQPLRAALAKAAGDAP